MANKTLFKSLAGKLAPKADTVNEAGGKAYAFTADHALAQYAATGCLNGTFYASAQDQLADILALCDKVSPEFIARTALYARQHGYMKDLPALLCAVLSVKGPGLLAEVFDRVIDNPKMLRNFVQIMRSGVVGRKSLGSLPKRLILDWLEARNDEQVFFGSVGNDPSLADIIKMVHPKPKSASREALYGYLIGRPIDREQLPSIVKQFDAYKSAEDRRLVETPDVPFQMLTGLELADWEWKAIARHAPWQMTRMNLNTFQRHGVFKDKQLTKLVTDRLRNEHLIRQAKVFPYQLLAAYTASCQALPNRVSDALQDAMEIALENVPAINGRVIVCPDVSGSMHSPATGYRKGVSTAVRCIDIAALVAAALLAGRAGRLMLSAQAGGFAATGDPLVFDKDAMRVGQYVHPAEKWTLAVDTARIDRIVETFKALKANGVTVDVTRDHSTSAKDKLGTVIDARREGDRLILRHRFADAEAVQEALRNQEVSVEIEPALTDGQGRRYTDALVASSIVRQPVVPGQSGFTRIAASRQSRDDEPTAEEIKAAADGVYGSPAKDDQDDTRPTTPMLSRTAGSTDEVTDADVKAAADQAWAGR